MRLNKGPLGKRFKPEELVGLVYRNYDGLICTMTVIELPVASVRIAKTKTKLIPQYTEKSLDGGVICNPKRRQYVWARILPKHIYPEFYL